MHGREEYRKRSHNREAMTDPDTYATRSQFLKISQDWIREAQLSFP